MDPLVTPVQQPIRRIPYHTKEKKQEPFCTRKTSCTSKKIQ